MGTWSSGPFDNDDAADWAWRLTPDADEAVVRATLAPEPGQRLPSDEVVVAAAEVVAAGIGRSHPELPDEVAAWVEQRRERPWRELARLAMAAVKGLVSEDHETDLNTGPYELDDLNWRLSGGAGPTASLPDA